VKFDGEEPEKAGVDLIGDAPWDFWVLGLGGSLLLVGLGAYGLVTGESWMLQRTLHFEGYEFELVTGKVAYLYSVGLLGAALAVFGWKVAYEMPALNPWYDWISGIGCLAVLCFLPWAYFLLLW
jgi:hypothetical protein